VAFRTIRLFEYLGIVPTVPFPVPRTPSIRGELLSIPLIPFIFVGFAAHLELTTTSRRSRPYRRVRVRFYRRFQPRLFAVPILLMGIPFHLTVEN